MPVGTDPPRPKLPQAVFNIVREFTYDATNQAFSQGGNLYFLFVEKPTVGSDDQAQWFYATDSEGGPNPKGLIPQLTATVIQSGTYQVLDQTISYQGQSYRISLRRDTSNGKQLAQAVTL